MNDQNDDNTHTHIVLTKGTMVSHYRIVEKIGAGGMGEVWLAHDEKLDRLIALKIPSPDKCDGRDNVAHMLKEARAAASLDHPNIVTVHEVGNYKGHPYIAMSYIDGPTLSELMKKQKMPIDMIVNLGVQLASGLTAAHEQGIIHRDLKPGNIMLDQSHNPRILDFGLSVAPYRASIDKDDTVTISAGQNAFVGTLTYMAPEQLTGGEITPLVDLFAFGVIMFELIYGIHPFKGESTQELCRNLLSDTSVNFPDSSEEHPYDLVRIVRRCLQKNPEHRFQTARDIRNELLELQRQLLQGDVFYENKQPGSNRQSFLSKEKFHISADLVRELQVQSAKMIGDHLEYLDNGVMSNTLVIYIHAWGLDYRQATDFLSALPYRGIAPTLYGFGQYARHRPPLTLNDHSILLRALFRRLNETIEPRYVVLSGFSSGADQIMHIATSDQDPGIEISGLLPFGCNVHLGSCFISAKFADLKQSNAEGLCNEIKQLGNNAQSLGEWLKFHEYMVTIFSKFGKNADALRALGTDIVKPFREKDWKQFAIWYREVNARYRHFRFVVDSDDNEIMDKILEFHLKENVLGDGFRESTIVREEVPHVELANSDILLRRTKEIIADIEGG
jgi:serine/threonine protein kinase